MCSSDLKNYNFIIIYNHNFYNHNIIYESSRVYFQVYQTKVFRNTFYCSNIRSLLSYAAPAWFTLLGDTNLEKLEKVPCSANRIILPNYEYDECLEMLCIPSLAKFLHELRQRDSSNIVSDSSHPLFSRLSFNN